MSRENKHPIILNILFVIDCGETLFFFFLFIMKRHLEENFFEGGKRDDVDDIMMIRTSVSSIIYSKEIDNWIINWPTDTASPIFCF